MRKLLTAPIFTDPAETETARLLYVILWTLGLAMTLVAPLGIIAQPSNAAGWLFAVAAVDGTCLVALAVTRRGRVRLAGYLLVALLWAFATGMAFTGGGIRSAAVPSYLIIILIAGLVLEERVGLITGIVCSVTALGLIFAEVSGALPASTVHHTLMTLWLSGILYAVCMMSLQYLASRTVKTALQRARQHQAEQERASQALHESQEQLERAEQMAHFGSWDWDLNTNGMSWSSETFRILGVSPGSTVPERSSFEGRVHPDDRVRVAKKVLRSLADQKPYTVQYRLLQPDGEERIVLEQGTPQCAAGDRPVRLVGTILDITGQRRVDIARERGGEQAPQLAAASHSAQGTILIVDDQAAVRSFAREALEQTGYRIVEAANGADALTRLSEAAFDLLISDLYLPGQGGGELVREASAKYPGLKVIIMSGAFEYVKEEPASVLGVSALLPKPVDPKTLVETVQRVLEQAGAKKNPASASAASAPPGRYLASQPPSTTRIEPLT